MRTMGLSSLRRLLQRVPVSPVRGRCTAARDRLRFRTQLEQLEDRTVPATVTWTATTSGFWDVGSNWSTGNVPQPGDDVVISDPARNLTITYRQTSPSIRSLDSDEAFTLSGGTLTVANPAPG